MDRAFVGDEQGLVRGVGLTVVVIGWLYLFGGRSGARQFVAASVVDRLIFVPVVLAPLAIAGVFPHLLLAFTFLDVSLAIGAWAFRSNDVIAAIGLSGGSWQDNRLIAHAAIRCAPLGESKNWMMRPEPRRLI